MFRHITMLIIALLLVFVFSACRPDSPPTFHAPENVNFEQAGQTTKGPTRITWSDRELVFYPLKGSNSKSQEFMMVDLMGDRSIEYILRNNRLEEARFSLTDGSLVRFDLVGFQESGTQPLVYHCTPYSNAFYELDALPEKLADSITGYNSIFANWKNQKSGIIHRSDSTALVPYEKILESVCCGAEML